MIVIELANRLPAMLKPADMRKLEKELARVLRTRSKKVASLSFVTELAMQKLNKTFRHMNKPTDVLSFSPAPAPTENRHLKTEHYLGDIVVCVPYAKREAARRGMTLREELLRLIAHGVLHLSGFDHATAKEEEKMFGLQERVVDAIISV
ncbi:rRNA maturation RNase YbeY [Candidatus Uhrbacteria bacterium]|nr:MAG: rRNA maturation RNase YbeY [Candidatus Uhrbacteria bacterium]